MLDRAALPGVPIASPLFANAKQAAHWTATPKWRVLFDPATVGAGAADPTTPGHPRCVRQAPLPLQQDLSSRYTVSAAALVVSDALTGRSWQIDAPTSGGSDGQGGFTVAAAKSYCEGLALEGGGWKLPAIADLEALVDPTISGKSPLPAVFKGVVAATYWSATPCGAGLQCAVEFSFGASLPQPDNGTPWGTLRVLIATPRPNRPALRAPGPCARPARRR